VEDKIERSRQGSYSSSEDSAKERRVGRYLIYEQISNFEQQGHKQIQTN